MSRRPVILGALCLASFTINLDTTIVNVTLPTLVRELDATTRDLQWIVDAYNLVFAALVLAAGSLSDRWGRKGALLIGLGIFASASMVGALCQTPGQLIAVRAVMGIGAAVIFPTTLSIISNVFTERSDRARAIGIWGATTGLGVALGPITGGWLLEHFWWGSVFVGLVPVAAVVAVLVALVVPTSRDPRAPRLDLPGLATSTLAIGALVFTIIEAPEVGWTSVQTVGGFAAALALVVAFVAVERRTAEPMMDVGLFGNLRFTAASGAVMVAFFALFGFIFLVTQYFQFLKGYSPLETGLRTVPVALSIAVGSVLGTKLAVAIGNKVIVAGGLTFLAIAFTWVSTASTETPYLEIALQMVLLGLGMGLTSAPATEAIMGVVPKEKAGIGSAVNDATRELGGTLGVAVIGSTFASLYRAGLGPLPAGLPEEATEAINGGIGGAVIAAERIPVPALADQVVAAASTAFYDGFAAGCRVAAGVAAVGAVAVAVLLPARPRVEGGSALDAPDDDGLDPAAVAGVGVAPVAGR